MRAAEGSRILHIATQAVRLVCQPVAAAERRKTRGREREREGGWGWGVGREGARERESHSYPPTSADTDHPGRFVHGPLLNSGHAGFTVGFVAKPRRPTPRRPRTATRNAYIPLFAPLALLRHAQQQQQGW